MAEAVGVRSRRESGLVLWPVRLSSQLGRGVAAEDEERQTGSGGRGEIAQCRGDTSRRAASAGRGKAAVADPERLQGEEDAAGDGTVEWLAVREAEGWPMGSDGDRRRGCRDDK